MSERKNNKKYTFTVEGCTEKWYFDWLKNTINSIPESVYSVSIDAKVQQNPLKFAKAVNPIAVPSAVHICDYESNDDVHVQKFRGILDQLDNANKLKGRSFQYSLGYSNFTFELWMVLHKIDCNGTLIDRTQYLKHINRAYNANFENLAHYKNEANFKWCLNQLSINDVKSAIARSKKIMNMNQQNNAAMRSYKGFEYYIDNPSLTIWKSVEKILDDCGLADKTIAARAECGTRRVED